MMKNRWSLNIIFLFIISILVVSCVKNDVLENVVMDQTFSLPLGEKELKIDTPTRALLVRPGDTIGKYGNFYFNGKKYRLNVLYFRKSSQIDFKLDSMDKIDWIQRMDLKVRMINKYPVRAHFQVYLLGSDLQLIDSVFTDGPKTCEPGEVFRSGTNFEAEPTDSTINIFDVSFEGDRLTRLKSTKYLSYYSAFETWRDDKEILIYSYHCETKINVGMRLYLKYKLEDF